MILHSPIASGILQWYSTIRTRDCSFDYETENKPFISTCKAGPYKLVMLPKSGPFWQNEFFPVFYFLIKNFVSPKVHWTVTDIADPEGHDRTSKSTVICDPFYRNETLLCKASNGDTAENTRFVVVVFFQILRFLQNLNCLHVLNILWQF